MTDVLPTPPASNSAADEPAVGAPAVPERPALASGVELVGELKGSGFVETQWLVQRDGRFIQLTELLYRVAECADGQRDLAEMATAVTEATEWLVSADDVRHLLRTKLIPAGVIAGPADGAPAARPPQLTSPLALNLKVKAIGPRAIDRVARVLQYLFAPPLLIAGLGIIAASHIWLYRERGLTAAFINALYTPSSLLVVLGVILLAAVAHEFGHASALRYGGGRARAMGAGFYLVFPAFFTDATDSYRLGRWARVRTGLGGVYFHLLFAVALIGIALALDLEFLLVAVLLINIEVLRQFIPFVRLDGYWVLADLTGIPDFFAHMVPFVRSIPTRLRGRSRAAGLRLKPWVERVFAGYIAVTVPLLVVVLVFLVRLLPRFVTAIWDAVLTQLSFISAAYREGDVVAVATAIAQLLVLALPVAAIAYLLYTLTWKPLRALSRARTPRMRILGTLAVLAAAVGVAFLWAPYLPFAQGAAPIGVRTFEVTDRRHVTTPVEYPQTPPVGGSHAPVWQNCGFYAAPIADENAVHALEHGAVWVAYRPGLPESDLEVLRELARQTYVLVSAYPGLPETVVVSSWGRQLHVASVRDSRLKRFVEAYRLDERAPERGSPCTGGTGTPE